MTAVNDQVTDAIAAELHRAVRDDGFCFVPGATMRGLLERHQPMDDWTQFAKSWDSLGPDTYLASRGRQRKRRYAAFKAPRDGAIERAPHRAHYQSLHYNPLQGDIERWFEPVAPTIADSCSLRAILEFSRGFFRDLAPAVVAWQIELHQFRIEAHAGEPGEPTPEGMHRDGVDYVLVLLVSRFNIARGTTMVHGEGGHELGHFTLTAPMDSALVDDGRVFHGVTAVVPLDPAKPAHRDVLVVTFRAMP